MYSLPAVLATVYPYLHVPPISQIYSFLYHPLISHTILPLSPAGHLAFWLGAAVGHYVPALSGGAHNPRPPALLLQVADVLVELFSFGKVAPNRLAEARLAGIYAAFMYTPPPPKGGGQVAP
jgi:hypothetical protein